MNITLREAPLGYLLVADDGRERFLQFESDFASVARLFGMRSGGEPDRQSPSVRDYLDRHVGASVEDPGYFDQMPGAM
jgi:hypothetical protein